MPKYWLIFQVTQPTTLEAFDNMIALEGAIEDRLAPEADTAVDGHDSGMGEYNIFIITNYPEPVFHAVAEVIGERMPDLPFSSAYRSLKGEDYTILWPPGLTSFAVA